jgi:hypothetical protein
MKKKASYQVGTGDPFPGVKRSRVVTLTSHPLLEPRSRMSRSYAPLPLSIGMASSGIAFYLHVGQKNHFT